MQRLFVELKRLIQNPVEAATTSIESFNVWRASREWLRILPALPIALTLLTLVLYLTIRATTAEQQRAITYLEAMEAEYPLADLENVLYRNHIKLNKPASNADPANASDLTKAEQSKPEPTPELLDSFTLTLNRVKQVTPNNDDVTYRLAIIDELKGNSTASNEAIHSLVRSTGIPMFSAYHWEAINLLNKRMSGQVVVDAELDRVLARAVEWRAARPDLLAAVGLRLISQNKVDRGLELLLNAAEKEPSRYLMTATLAKNYGKERVFSKAIEHAEKDFRAQVGITGEDPKDRIGYAECLILKDQVKQAIEILRAGINDQTIAKPELKRALSNVYLREYRIAMQGKPANEVDSLGIANLLQAIETDPMNPNLGRPAVALLSGTVTLPDAITKTLQDMLKEQLKANVTTPDTLMILGSLYYQKKMYKEASNVWQKVVEAVPTAVDALNNLSVLEFELPNPKPELALERIERAFQFAPNNVEICDSYGQVLMKINRPQDAIPKFERALRIDPNRPNTRKLLAECYASIGQQDISDAQLRFIATSKEEKPAASDNSASDNSVKEPPNAASSTNPNEPKEPAQK